MFATPTFILKRCNIKLSSNKPVPALFSQLSSLSTIVFFFWWRSGCVVRGLKDVD